MNPKVLVVDSDEQLVYLLIQRYSNNLDIKFCHDGSMAREFLSSIHFNLVILSADLPDGDSIKLLVEFRNRSIIPVILLFSASNELDRICGLDVGADDCIEKPFSFDELFSRIRAVLRRTELNGENYMISLSSNLYLDGSTHHVLYNGIKIRLTAVEYHLLKFLKNAAGEVVSRAALYKCILGRDLTVHDRSIDIHISNIRRKLRNFGPSFSIRSIRGKGYLLMLR